MGKSVVYDSLPRIARCSYHEFKLLIGGEGDFLSLLRRDADVISSLKATCASWMRLHHSKASKKFEQEETFSFRTGTVLGAYIHHSYSSI